MRAAPSLLIECAGRKPRASALQPVELMKHHRRMPESPLPAIAYADFEKVDIRVGRILRAEAFPDAKKPAYRLTIDFGPEIGTKRSSAQLTARYALGDLPGRLVLGVVNFPPRQIGPFMSEVLTLGVPDTDGAVVLIEPERDVPIGGRMY